MCVKFGSVRGTGAFQMLSLVSACVWLLVVNIRAMFSSRDHHWRFAYAMIVLGIPILGWVTYENGPWIGLLVLLAAASILRWPLIYLWRWIKSRLGS